MSIPTSSLGSLGGFLEQTIQRRDDLILPLHGGPVPLDEESVALQAEIREKLTGVLLRGQREGGIDGDVSATDIIFTGAMLAQPLPQVDDRDTIARRQARIFLAGLVAAGSRRQE